MEIRVLFFVIILMYVFNLSTAVLCTTNNAQCIIIIVLLTCVFMYDTDDLHDNQHTVV